MAVGGHEGSGGVEAEPGSGVFMYSGWNEPPLAPVFKQRRVKPKKRVVFKVWSLFLNRAVKPNLLKQTLTV